MTTQPVSTVKAETVTLSSISLPMAPELEVVTDPEPTQTVLPAITTITVEISDTTFSNPTTQEAATEPVDLPTIESNTEKMKITDETTLPSKTEPLIAQKLMTTVKSQLNPGIVI